MNGEFLSSFLSDCISKGMNSTTDICSYLEKQIEDFDLQISRLEEFKNRQSKLRAVLKQLGGLKHRDDEPEKVIRDFSIPAEKLNEKFKGLCDNICEFLNKNSDGILPSDIMNNISSIEDNHNVYSAIKWLVEHNVVKRDVNRKIVKGEGWQEYQ